MEEVVHNVDFYTYSEIIKVDVMKESLYIIRR